MMMQFKSTGYCRISLEDLRYSLALFEKYEATKDLRKWVIDTAVKEINEKTPIQFIMN
jgi:plasmid replication initiation protein